MIPAKHFVKQIAANINNENLTDAEFREFIRNTLPIVDVADEYIPDPPRPRYDSYGSFVGYYPN